MTENKNNTQEQTTKVAPEPVKIDQTKPLLIQISDPTHLMLAGAMVQVEQMLASLKEQKNFTCLIGFNTAIKQIEELAKDNKKAVQDLNSALLKSFSVIILPGAKIGLRMDMNGVFLEHIPRGFVNANNIAGLSAKESTKQPNPA